MMTKNERNVIILSLRFKEFPQAVLEASHIFETQPNGFWDCAAAPVDQRAGLIMYDMHCSISIKAKGVGQVFENQRTKG